MLRHIVERLFDGPHSIVGRNAEEFLVQFLAQFGAHILKLAGTENDVDGEQQRDLYFDREHILLAVVLHKAKNINRRKTTNFWRDIFK